MPTATGKPLKAHTIHSLFTLANYFSHQHTSHIKNLCAVDRHLAKQRLPKSHSTERQLSLVS